jgi:4-hydroxybutyrate CoA-transferase
MPRTFGDGVIHHSQIDYGIDLDFEIAETSSPELSDIEKRIGENVASLIPNGATLQVGIGAIPDAVLNSLYEHKDLGIHTEMFSNSLIPLLENGVVNNSQKNIHPHKVVSGFAVGDRKLMDYVDNNPSFNFLNIAYVNHPNVIKRNPKVMAINSAVEVDLTGQICADSIGSNIISGVGGQMDFMRGATFSKGGKAIIALPSRTRKGESRINSTLKLGAGVVTTRQHIQYIVTEFGVAYLFGKTLKERAQALINIAHPEDRDRLESELRAIRSL